ncbi:PREDICTED: 23 kDa integral membrane protein-like [Papilio polytes]|uniref:23 kDa integral membrane protein-like n=1 Tax=Papilio polytes TaxID=76194 RepID=UPI000675F737|nr:PREDICTED: 23 kDa integral membrane protein-like [Papilio polytes]
MMCDWASVGKICAKWLLFVLNGLCILIAVGTTIFAIVDIKVLNKYGDGAGHGTQSGDTLIIIVCLLLFAVAVFGCIGTAKENVKILCLYVGFLMLFLVVELLVAVYVAVQRYGLEFRVSESMRNQFFRNFTTEELAQHKKIWDDMQITYECCGLNGPEDYQAIRQPISISCCPRAFRAKTDYARHQFYQTCLESKSYFNVGCEDEILQEIRADEDWLIGVTIISSWFQAAQVLAAMWLSQMTKREAQFKQQTLRH